MPPVPSRHLAAALLVLAAGTACAQATIDQTKALAGGVTPGDVAGFPVTLSVPGHYILKSNLVVPAGTSGVEITAADVTLDLNGFSIVGPGTCTRDAATRVVSCSVANSGKDGVVSSQDRLVVRNGSVRGFAGAGVVGRGMTVERVSSMHNAGLGIVGRWGSTSPTRISESHSELNGATGLQLGGTGGGIVERTRVVMNGGSGIIATLRYLVTDSVTLDNRNVGLMSAAAKGTLSASNGTNRTSVISLGGNLDDTATY